MSGVECWSGRRRLASVLAGVFVALSLSTGSPVRAQDGLGGSGSSISGRVEVENIGAPSERLEVTMQRVAGAAGNRRVFTELGGNFLFTGVTAGNYVVSVRPPIRTGYSEGSAEVTVTSSNNPLSFFVTISIRREAAEKTGIVSGRMISAQDNDAGVPKAARVAYKKGTAAARKNAAADAIMHFQRAIDIAPDYLFALNDLGVQYTRSGRYADSISVLERAVAKAPKSFPPRLNLAIALYGADRFADSSREVAVALDLDPAAPDALFLSGMVERRRGNAELAIVAFQKAYQEGGADAIYAQFELGQLYDTSGQSTAAVKAYRLFLQFVPQGPHSDYARRRLRAIAAG